MHIIKVQIFIKSKLIWKQGNLEILVIKWCDGPQAHSYHLKMTEIYLPQHTFQEGANLVSRNNTVIFYAKESNNINYVYCHNVLKIVYIQIYCRLFILY